MKINWNLVLSIITGITALIAIFQTSCQIKLSNKQHLLDRRLKNYTFINGLLKLYKKNQSIFEKREENIQFTVDREFLWLTNNSYMEKQYEVMKHPLDPTYQALFLKRLEELSEMATETNIIFTGKAAISYSDFLSAYVHTLFRMYQYQILVNDVKELTKGKCGREMTIKEAGNTLSEENYRKEMYAAMDNLKNAYKAIEDTKSTEKIAKQIKLK